MTRVVWYVATRHTLRLRRHLTPPPEKLGGGGGDTQHRLSLGGGFVRLAVVALRSIDYFATTRLFEQIQAYVAAVAEDAPTTPAGTLSLYQAEQWLQRMRSKLLGMPALGGPRLW